MASPGPRGPSYQSIEFLVAILCLSLGYGQRKGGRGGAGAGEGLRGGVSSPHTPSAPCPGPECRPRRSRGNVVGWDTPGRTQTGRSESHHQGPRALSFQLSRRAGPADHSLYSAHSTPAVPGLIIWPLAPELKCPLSGSLLRPPLLGKVHPTPTFLELALDREPAPSGEASPP